MNDTQTPTKEELERLALLFLIESKISDDKDLILFEEPTASEYLQQLTDKYQHFFIVKLTDLHYKKIKKYHQRVESIQREFGNIVLLKNYR
jgi:hypothetical protein